MASSSSIATFHLPVPERITLRASAVRLKRLARRKLDDLLRGRLVAAYRLLRPRITEKLSGGTVTYEPATDIGRALFFTGEFERDELEVCRKYISPQSTVLDIGANIGLHSLFFSGIASDGFVLALEPDLDTFEMLRANTGSRSNIVPLDLAISDAGGVLQFFQGQDGAYSSLTNTKRTAIAKTTRVPCMKIDDVVDGLGLQKVDFVKIDVEGLEYNVLRGMVQVITSFHPVIFCEIYKGTASNMAPDETVGFLLDRGYRAFVLRDGGLVPYQRHDDEFYNYLFLPEHSELP